MTGLSPSNSLAGPHNCPAVVTAARGVDLICARRVQQQRGREAVKGSLAEQPTLAAPAAGTALFSSVSGLFLKSLQTICKP